MNALKGIEVIQTQRQLGKIIDNLDEEIAEEMAKCYLDPYRFVLAAFDWGRGELEKHEGPDKWQTAFLKSIRDELNEMREDEERCDDPLFYSTKAGHGVGKSAATAWICVPSK